jgi:uncharacterized membrane protein
MSDNVPVVVRPPLAQNARVAHVPDAGPAVAVAVVVKESIEELSVSGMLAVAFVYAWVVPKLLKTSTSATRLYAVLIVIPVNVPREVLNSGSVKLLVNGVEVLGVVLLNEIEAAEAATVATVKRAAPEINLRNIDIFVLSCTNFRFRS